LQTNRQKMCFSSTGGMPMTAWHSGALARSRFT